MAKISIKQLEAFVQVADLASFRRAASALKTTQPNISTRIARLEELLGQTLMERDAGSVRLTPAGKQLLGKARAVLNSLDDFIVAAKTPGLFEGTLRLGVTEMIVHSWLSEYLSVLRERFPNIKVELTADLSANLTIGLNNHSIDLALQSGPFGEQTTGNLTLGSYEMAWVVSPTLGVKKKIPDRTTLCQHPILTHARQTLPFKQLEKHLAAEPNAYLVPSTGLGVCLQMTLQGLGVACLPRAMVTTDIKNKRLMQLHYPWLPDNLLFNARFHAEKAPYHLREAAQLAKQVAAEYTAN